MNDEKDSDVVEETEEQEETEEEKEKEEQEEKGEEDEEPEDENEEEPDEEEPNEQTWLLGPQDDSGPLYVLKKPTMIPRAVQRTMDQQNLWFIDDKQDAASLTKMRMKMEEGFYVGRLPHISSRNLSRLEQRLKKTEDSEKWFDQYGALYRERVPIRGLQAPFEEVVRPLSHQTPQFPVDDSWIEYCRYRPERLGYGKEMGTVVDRGEAMATRAGMKRFQLDIDVIAVQFDDHPFFIEEDLLSNKLISLYNEYVRRREESLVGYYSERLEALSAELTSSGDKRIERALPKRRMTLDLATSALKENEEKAMRFRKQMRQLRQLRDAELYGELLATKKMIKIWNDIKKLRISQGFTSSRVKMSVRKYERTDEDITKEKAEWEKEIEDEVEEARQEHILAHKQKVADWLASRARIRNARKSWEEQAAKRKKKDERKGRMERLQMRRKARRGSEEFDRRQSHMPKRDDEEDEIDEPNDDMMKFLANRPDFDQELKDLGPEPKISTFEEERIRSTITQRAERTKRTPGAPIIVPHVSNEGTPTPMEHLKSLDEKERRKNIQAQEVAVKISIHNNTVTKTRSARVKHPDFTAEISQVFHLSVARWPDSIKLTIVEPGVKDREIGAVFVGIPYEISEQAHPETPYIFSSQDVYFPLWQMAKVGDTTTAPPPPAADPTKLLQPMPSERTVGGSVLLKASWAVGPDGFRRAPPPPSGLSRRAAAREKMQAGLTAGGLVDPVILKAWLKASQLDPNDPANRGIVQLMQSAAALEGKVRGFSLKASQNELTLVDELDLPKKEEEALPMEPGTMGVGVTGKTPRFIDQIREKKIVRSVQAHKSSHMRYSDIVREMALPDINLASEFLGNAFRQRRKLRPHRKERKVVSVFTNESNLVIDVRRGYNIPARRFTPRRDQDLYTALPQAGGENGATKTADINEDKPSDVMPFVEITFQGKTVRTTVIPGSTPEWKDSLVLPFDPGLRGFTPDNLASISENIAVNLFDDVTYDISSDAGRSDVKMKRKEKRWLGCIDIPFSTVYQNKHIQGEFRVNTPPVIIGYETESARKEASRLSTDVMLSLFVTLEPPLPVEQPVDEMFAGEDPRLQKRMMSWAQSNRNRKVCAGRNITASCADMEGKSLLITRYIRPQNYPEELSTEEEIVRFVSMIPFVEDAVSFEGRGNVWADSASFLEIGAGDWEEHAILLCNYFLKMGKEAWVILGDGIPEGQTSYVLTSEQGQHFLWNAVTGKVFRASDPHVPLRRIGVVFNNHNVWCNIQDAAEPHRMKFNLVDTASWDRLFTPKITMPTSVTSIQAENIEYEVTPDASVKRIQIDIESALIRKFEKLRKHVVTRWNTVCSRYLREILSIMEKDRLGLLKLSEEEHNQRLGRIPASYYINGFPINLPLTDIEAISERLSSTGLHSIEDRKVEFALAVYVHKFPSNIFSVWVYVASLLPKE